MIGVMPKEFALSPWVDSVAFWAASDLRQVPVARWMTAIGRLKPGVCRLRSVRQKHLPSAGRCSRRGEKTDKVGANVVPISTVPADTKLRITLPPQYEPRVAGVGDSGYSLYCISPTPRNSDPSARSRLKR